MIDLIEDLLFCTAANAAFGPLFFGYLPVASLHFNAAKGNTSCREIFVGIAVGLSTSLVPLSISEVSQKLISRTTVGLTQLFGTI